jgi:hypothetical protein
MSLRLILAHIAPILIPLLPLTAAAQIVTPQGAEITRNAQTTGNVVWFSVENNSDEQQQFSLSCSRSGAVSSCTRSGSVTIDGWSSADVSVTFNTGAAGTGTVHLYVDNGLLDHGWYDVTVTGSSAPTVTAPAADTVLSGEVRTLVDSVRNSGGSPATYNLSATGPGARQPHTT